MARAGAGDVQRACKTSMQASALPFFAERMPQLHRSDYSNYLLWQTAQLRPH